MMSAPKDPVMQPYIPLMESNDHVDFVIFKSQFSNENTFLIELIWKFAIFTASVEIIFSTA